MHTPQQYPGFVAVQQPDGTIVYQPAQQPAAYPAPQQQPPQAWSPQGPPVAPAAAFGPPQQWGPQAGPPPGYQQPQFAPPPGPQGGAWPQSAPPMPGPPPAYPQQMSGPPAFFMPSQAEFAQMYQRAQQQQQQVAAARAGFNGPRKSRDLKFPGPNGERKWSGVPIGFERRLVMRIMPSPVAHRSYFVEAPKHFWKSKAHPQGSGGWCPGAGCRLCAAAEAASGSSDEGMIKRAKMARSRGHRLYQVFVLGSFDVHSGQIDSRGWLDEHKDEMGRVKPLLFDVPSDVHTGFMNHIATRGVAAYLDPARGMPFVVTRKKTGPQDVDIEYSVMDMTQFAGPLPAEFGFGPNGEGIELLDLSKFMKPMSMEDQEKAIAELELGARPQAYQATVGQPPAPSPFGAGPPPGYQGQPPQQQPPPGWQGAPPQQAQQQYAYAQSGYQQPLPAAGPPPAQPGQLPAVTQGGWAPPAPPPVLPSTGQPPPASFPAPRVDPWSEAGAMAQRPGEPPPGWQPPATQSPPQWSPPPAAASPAQWAPPAQAGQPPASLTALQAQLTGQMIPPAPQGPAAAPGGQSPQGLGPAYPPPPGAAAPPPR